MKKLILITIFFSSVSLSQILTHFESSFVFSDLFNNSEVLILGYDSFATDSLDPNLGEMIVAQVPAGNFGVRFQLPSDTSLYTLNDFRFGCGQPFYYEHLFDLSYSTGSSIIDIDWEWGGFELWSVYVINPYTGQNIATLQSFLDSSYYSIPASMEKIILGIQYEGPISWPAYQVISPNGGEILEAGEIHSINWQYNGIGDFVDIEYSTDVGENWTLIVDSLFIFFIQSFEWQVPFVNSENCLIRFGIYPCAYDDSDSVFTIIYPVSTENETELPTGFYLLQNYPNPFNPNTIISYQIPKLSFVTLKVYDVLGNEVATLVNEEKPAGSYEVKFKGAGLPSGIYFYQLKADSYIKTRKMVLMK